MSPPLPLPPPPSPPHRPGQNSSLWLPCHPTHQAFHSYSTYQNSWIVRDNVKSVEVLIGLFKVVYQRARRISENTSLRPMWPGFDSQIARHIWVEFVVGSRPFSERLFSEYSSFPLSSKTNISSYYNAHLIISSFN